ncbi:MAG: ATP-dependent DNA helicase RecG [Pseudomonadota bacterium]
MNTDLSATTSTSLAELSCSVLKGVGPSLLAKLQKLGIETIQDLLFHLPRAYQDRTRIMPLRHIRPGQVVAIEAAVKSSEVLFRGRRQLICLLSDGTGFLTVRFFHFNRSQYEHLKTGFRLRCFGEVRFGKNGHEMIHPEYVGIRDDQPALVEEYLTPVYPTTEGISQYSWRRLQSQALQLIDRGMQELLPPDLLQKFKFSNLKDTLLYLHRPPPDAPIQLLLEGKHPFQTRLIFEELLAHYLSLRKLREHAKKHSAVVLSAEGALIKNFLQQLPFQLTHAQQRVYQEIADDLSHIYPMMRLVQGDVGSGKTVVSALAVLHAVSNNCQAVVMAPTELLAEQHLKNFQHWLTPLNIKVAWLSGQLKAKERRETLAIIESGEAQVIIGTHALFQEGVEFKRLALMVVDEQHRFGVHQRLALREKGYHDNKYPHQLIMTATPIPRTLAMSAYADLDHSFIDELPPGRKPVTTTVLSSNRRDDVIARIRQACHEKRQVYWVCTLIEESEILQCQAAEKTAESLKQVLPDCHIALIHGRMKTLEKDQIMQDFKAKRYDLLVATTVIEVGVDVPNASLMVIENAERLGLAQLHQLRGRIGRGSVESYCVLLYQRPLSESAIKRLAIMRKSCDGFLIAQKDLEIRGPGEVLGTKQAGIIGMRIANIVRDQYLLPKVQAVSLEIIHHHASIIPLLEHRWIESAEDYGRV